MRVAVFGATGDQGLAQLERLRAAGHRPVAAVRDPARLPGWETRAADYRDPDSVARAIDGSDAVFVTLPSTSFDDAAPVERAAGTVADAAATAGTGIVVFNSSMWIGDAPLGFPAQDARFRMRARFLAGPVPAVSIQPVIYMGNLLRGWAWQDVVDDGVIRYPHDAGLEVSWISQEAAADLMIAALTRPALVGCGVNVGGPEAIRGPDLARRLSPFAGRTLRFESLPINRFTERMAARFADRSLPADTIRRELGRIYRWYNEDACRPFRVDPSWTRRALGIDPESLEDWAARQRWHR